jgi:hypothetical protein
LLVDKDGFFSLHFIKKTCLIFQKK